MNITFLFGAGVSIPSNILKTSSITNLILEGKNVVRGNAENYYIDDPNRSRETIYAEAPQRVQVFLKILKNQLAEYYQNKNRSINYEDIYNLLDFIFRNYRSTEGNPSLKYLMKELEPEIKKLLISLDEDLDIKFELNDLLKETKIYIKDLVTIILSQKVESFLGLNFLRNYIKENPSSQINLFTLNHDTILEQFFESERIEFNDGFEKSGSDYHFWNPNLFEQNSLINLFKIHGSVNWHYYDETSWVDRRICKVSQKMFWREPRKSILLIGTDNKLSEYIRGMFLELYYRFYKNLNFTETLIVVGYSFGDYGINEKLFDWVLQGNNRMIIIDPLVEDLKEKIWPVLYSEWENERKIKPIKEYVENITWARISKDL